jgi:hypothetical protein
MIRHLSSATANRLRLWERHGIDPFFTEDSQGWVRRGGEGEKSAVFSVLGYFNSILQCQIGINKSTIEYIFIVHLFNIIKNYIFLYNIGQIIKS